MELGLGRTNATKAVIGGLVSAGLSLATAFGFDLSGEQVGAINAFVDAILIAWIALSYKDSPKRVENEETVAIIKEIENEAPDSSGG
jgi:hypothetical protein